MQLTTHVQHSPNQPKCHSDSKNAINSTELCLPADCRTREPYTAPVSRNSFIEPLFLWHAAGIDAHDEL